MNLFRNDPETVAIASPLDAMLDQAAAMPSANDIAAGKVAPPPVLAHCGGCGFSAPVDSQEWNAHRHTLTARQRRRLEAENRQRRIAEAAIRSTRDCPDCGETDIEPGTTHRCPGPPVPPYQKAVAAAQAEELAQMLRGAGYSVEK